MTAAAPLSGTGAFDVIESYEAHAARFGPLPPPSADLIDELDRSGLRGRGGASFPVATKWRAVASRARSVVLVNGAEGEPLSHKDRTLMSKRPHLVIDGAVLAARAVGAGEIIVYAGREHGDAVASMERAVAARAVGAALRIRVVRSPQGYVSGEESAAVHYINDGTALPTTVPPRPFEQGVAGRPTLVQNVETLAHVALIARYGADWYRGLGLAGAAGTALVTVSGAVPETAVREVALGAVLGDAVTAAGGLTEDTHAVLLGGYFGSWVPADVAWGLPLDASALRAHHVALGCGVIGVLPASRCGVVTTSRIASYLAEESARQCGPCVFGLRAIADSLQHIAAREARIEELQRVQRWAEQLTGRGACHHPDGAATLVASALRVFASEYSLHARERRCTHASAPPLQSAA